LSPGQMQKRKVVSLVFTLAATAIPGYRYKLPYDPEISKTIFGGVQVLEPGIDISTSATMQGGSLNPVSAANLKHAFLTLVDENNTILYRDLPLYAFTARIENGNIRDIFENKISLDKSYIRFTNAVSAGIILLNFITYQPG